MAQITREKSARHRIQFSMRPEMHKRYTAYKQKAKSLGLEVDFKRNFENWFEGQLEQLARELDRNTAHQSKADNAENNLADRQ